MTRIDPGGRDGEDPGNRVPNPGEPEHHRGEHRPAETTRSLDVRRYGVVAPLRLVVLRGPHLACSLLVARRPARGCPASAQLRARRRPHHRPDGMTAAKGSTKEPVAV